MQVCTFSKKQMVKNIWSINNIRRLDRYIILSMQEKWGVNSRGKPPGNIGVHDRVIIVGDFLLAVFGVSNEIVAILM